MEVPSKLVDSLKRRSTKILLIIASDVICSNAHRIPTWKMGDDISRHYLSDWEAADGHLPDDDGVSKWRSADRIATRARHSNDDSSSALNFGAACMRGATPIVKRKRPQSACSASALQRQRQIDEDQASSLQSQTDRNRPQSAKPRRGVVSAASEPRWDLPSAQQVSKWREMLLRSPDFRQPRLQRLENETYELLRYVLGNQRQRREEEPRLGTSRRRPQQNGKQRKRQYNAESMIRDAVACGSGAQVARSRRNHPKKECQQKVIEDSNNSEDINDHCNTSSEEERRLIRERSEIRGSPPCIPLEAVKNGRKKKVPEHSTTRNIRTGNSPVPLGRRTAERSNWASRASLTIMKNDWRHDDNTKCTQPLDDYILAVADRERSSQKLAQLKRPECRKVQQTYKNVNEVPATLNQSNGQSDMRDEKKRNATEIITTNAKVPTKAKIRSSQVQYCRPNDQEQIVQQIFEGLTREVESQVGKNLAQKAADENSLEIEVPNILSPPMPSDEVSGLNALLRCPLERTEVDGCSTERNGESSILYTNFSDSCDKDDIRQTLHEGMELFPSNLNQTASVLSEIQPPSLQVNSPRLDTHLSSQLESLDAPLPATVGQLSVGQNNNSGHNLRRILPNRVHNSALSKHEKEPASQEDSSTLPRGAVVDTTSNVELRLEDTLLVPVETVLHSDKDKEQYFELTEGSSASALERAKCEVNENVDFDRLIQSTPESFPKTSENDTTLKPSEESNPEAVRIEEIQCLTSSAISDINGRSGIDFVEWDCIQGNLSSSDSGGGDTITSVKVVENGTEQVRENMGNTCSDSCEALESNAESGLFDEASSTDMGNLQSKEAEPTPPDNGISTLLDDENSVLSRHPPLSAVSSDCYGYLELPSDDNTVFVGDKEHGACKIESLSVVNDSTMCVEERPSETEMETLPAEQILQAAGFCDNCSSVVESIPGTDQMSHLTSSHVLPLDVSKSSSDNESKLAETHGIIVPTDAHPIEHTTIEVAEAHVHTQENIVTASELCSSNVEESPRSEIGSSSSNARIALATSVNAVSEEQEAALLTQRDEEFICNPQLTSGNNDAKVAAVVYENEIASSHLMLNMNHPADKSTGANGCETSIGVTSMPSPELELNDFHLQICHRYSDSKDTAPGDGFSEHIDNLSAVSPRSVTNNVEVICDDKSFQPLELDFKTVPSEIGPESSCTAYAIRIQRQFRRFSVRRLIMDQLHFFLSSHRRQARKKAKRESLLEPCISDAHVDPKTHDVGIVARDATDFCTSTKLIPEQQSQDIEASVLVSKYEDTSENVLKNESQGESPEKTEGSVILGIDPAIDGETENLVVSPTATDDVQNGIDTNNDPVEDVNENDFSSVYHKEEDCAQQPSLEDDPNREYISITPTNYFETSISENCLLSPTELEESLNKGLEINSSMLVELVDNLCDESSVVKVDHASLTGGTSHEGDRLFENSFGESLISNSDLETLQIGILETQWERYMDLANNKSFYYNRETGESQWTAPGSEIVVNRILDDDNTANAVTLEHGSSGSMNLRTDDLTIGQEENHEKPVDDSYTPWESLYQLSQDADKQNVWQAFVDEATQQTFYYNLETGECSWTVPHEFEAAQPQTESNEIDSDWVMYIDPSSGLPYYVNLKTNETVWEKPSRGSSVSDVEPAALDLCALALDGDFEDEHKPEMSWAAIAGLSNPQTTTFPIDASQQSGADTPYEDEYVIDFDEEADANGADATSL